MNDLTIHNRSGASIELTFEGRRGTYGFAAMSPERLRANADTSEQRANDELRRVRMLRAVANVLEAEEAARKAEASEQRRRRSAATRAHNADPFGFKALEAQAR